MDDFYAARDSTMPPLPWPSIAPPFTQSWSDPKATRTRALAPERVSGGDLLKGPYVAETVEVETDGDYVVVDV